MKFIADATHTVLKCSERDDIVNTEYKYLNNIKNDRNIGISVTTFNHVRCKE